jgi:hypothetical protein
MKKAAVPTTAAKGTAVSSSRITAVQSVYIPVSEAKSLPSSQQSCPPRMPASRPTSLAIPAMALFVLVVSAPYGRAGVRFENCVRGPAGSLTCDTVPTGDTYLNDKDAQFGLFQNASPGWNEFNPFQGYDEDFGDDPY